MVPRAALSHQQRLQQLRIRTLLNGRRIWGQMRPGDRWTERFIEETGPRLTALLLAAQAAATAETDVYVADVLRELDIAAGAVPGAVPRDAVAGWAGDGREITSLLGQSVVVAGASYNAAEVQNQATAQSSLDRAGRWLDMALTTVLADTARATETAAIASHRNVGGYVRMLVPPSCSRCAILAGRFYQTNEGFLRHPRCDCRHIPASEAIAGDITTNPSAYFDSLSGADQDRIFTKAGAQAIRDGADLNQVVNARRGMSTAQINPLTGASVGRLQRRTVYGRDVFVTTEGTTRRGLAYRALNTRFQNPASEVRGRGERYFRTTNVRLMPESIYEIAGNDRAEVIRLLKLHGFLN